MAYTTIDDPSAYFHTQLYTGNGSNRTITNDANAGDFKPDWLWVKHRNHSTAHSHNIADTTRGGTKTLYTNTSDKEETISNGLTGFATDGFTLGTNGAVNGGSVNYVAWQWKANGGATSTNNDGGNTSTVQANTTAGFSIVSYTRDSNSVTTVGHGLGKTPKVKIEKDRDTGSTNWSFITSASGSDQYGFLNTTATFGSTTSGFTSTVFRSAMGANQGAIIAYVFAEIQGYSKFGIYEGNGSTDGAFVYTGFKPSFIIMKPTNQSTEWTLQDTVRDPINPANKRLIPNDSIAEYTNTSCLTDFLSNGFKMRTNHPSNNSSGYTYFYMAFAEHPFVSSQGVPVTAR